jgi:hypothetical protein
MQRDTDQHRHSTSLGASVRRVVRARGWRGVVLGLAAVPVGLLFHYRPLATSTRRVARLLRMEDVLNNEIARVSDDRTPADP